MRTLFYTFILVLAPIFDTTFAEELQWQTDYEHAITIAKKEKKNVLLYFTGSDWCPPCKKLKTDLFETEAFKIASEDYVLLYVDIPRNKDLISKTQMAQNKTLLSKYNKKGVFPLLTVLSPRGVLLDDYSGYSMNGEVKYHLDFLEKNK